MILEKMIVGDLWANCYVIGCEKTKEAVVIDPGGDADLINNKLTNSDMEVKYIVNTHGHADHIAGNREVKNKTKAALCIHESDASMLTDSKLNLSAFTGKEVLSPAANKTLEDGDVIKFGELEAEVIATPGHTEGGICLKIEDKLFSGDTLFLEGIGRCDLPGGAEFKLLKSIRDRLFTLPEDTVVYPGHGESTTIGHEKESNPFLL